MIIDFHTHCFPDAIAEKAVNQLASKVDFIPYTNGTLDALLQRMDQCGCDKSVVLQIATKPHQQKAINDWAAEKTNDRFVIFGSIHPDAEDWEAELDRIKSLGLKGVKFHPDYQLFYINEERMFPIYQKIASLGLITVFHGGIDAGLYPERFFSHPKHLKEALPHFNGAPVVMAHMGGWKMWDEVEEHLVGEDVYLDTSMAMGIIDDDQMVRIINNHTPDKILFATDSPWSYLDKAIDYINSLPVSQTAKDKIFSGSALKLLRI